MKAKMFVLKLLLSSISLSVFAQIQNLEPRQLLSINNGLSHNGVTSICKDSRGYVWIGTFDGLTRYDGYECTVYKNRPFDRLFVNNRIRAIAEDTRGNLLLGTDEGLALMQYSTGRFKDIYTIRSENIDIVGPTIRDIDVLRDGTILCATEQEGILVFNSDYSFREKLFSPDELSEQGLRFFSTAVSDSVNYIFLSNNGLFVYNAVSKSYKLLLSELVGQHSALVHLSGENWLLTSHQGLVILKIQQEGNSYSIVPEFRFDSDEQFREAVVGKDGKIWLTSEREGLLVTTVEQLLKRKKLEFTARYAIRNSLFRASCILWDEQIGCWVGTFDRGILRFDIKTNPFLSYQPDVPYNFSVNDKRVAYINAWDRDRILLTTQTDGLVLFNTATNRFEPLPAELQKRNCSGISAVFVDSRRNIWVNHNGSKALVRWREEGKNEEKVLSRTWLDKNVGSLRQIVEDRYGDIWLVGHLEVIRIRIDKEDHIKYWEKLSDNDFFRQYLISGYRCVLPDPMFDVVWIGTNKQGLLRVKLGQSDDLKVAEIDRYSRDFKNPLSLSSNFVSCIQRLPNGDLWLGTERGGLCKVVNGLDNPEFVNYSEKEGLSNNVVKSIVWDKDMNLWVATNIGLNKFDIHTNQFRIFKKDNGLPFEDFYYSWAKLENGYIVLSGLNGFCYFNPSQVPEFEVLPKVVFNRFRLFNQVVNPGDTVRGRVLLDKCLAEQEHIVLRHNENVFSLEISALHYSTPENHFLRYQLSPINDDWVVVPSNQRVINYNGLPPGEYTLKVMASNSLNEWTAPKTLSITILPPFWKTLPAYFLYVLVLSLIVYAVIYYVLRINRLRHNLEIEHLEKENVKAVNEAKLRYFSNISHEIKTPLTLIMGPVEMMLERYKSNLDLSEKLEIVRRQSRKIWSLIEQVHDFQRSDANKLEMNYSTFCVNEFMNDLAVDFHFLAESENKNFEVVSANNLIYVTADRDKLEKVVNNLLNNAFKYTREGQSISLTYANEGNNLLISVKDTGRGIAPEDLSHIFERFYQSKHPQSHYTGGAGIGLAFSKRLVEMHYGEIGVRSELNSGSEFWVKLPVVTEKPEVIDPETTRKILQTEESFKQKGVQKKEIDFTQIEIESELQGAKVFVAEDNSDLRQFIQSVLSRFFTVKSFGNGQELFDALNEEWPDVIVSDVLMPEMNGLQLCEQVKTDIKTSHIPLILLTACTTIEDQLKGLKAGADAYISKPFDMVHLLAKIGAVLQNQRRVAERFKYGMPLVREKSETGELDSVFLEKLYDLIEENLDNADLDIDRLAKKMYLNRTHFYQKVKALTGQTPFELLKGYRLQRAAELLVKKKLSVSEVCLMTGFKSRSNFSKLFKERYNCTPGKYASQAYEQKEKV